MIPCSVTPAIWRSDRSLNRRPLAPLASTITKDGYRRNLNTFAALIKDKDADELLLRDYERFLDRWTDGSPSTLATGSLVRGLSRFLYERGYASSDVAEPEPLKRPTRFRAEDLNGVTVSRDDVGRLIDACVTWQETLCIATAVYCGARRGALASVRLRDVDLNEGTITFFEKVESGYGSLSPPSTWRYYARPSSTGSGPVKTPT